MRKNGVNRQLKEIDGGVCSPSGFLASAVYCGIAQTGSEKPDLGLVYAERRCPTACVYTTREVKGAPVLVSQRHLSRGYAQALVFNSGVANVFSEDGEALAESVCKLVGKYTAAQEKEVLVASTGKMGGKLSLESFEKGIPLLVKEMNGTHENSLLAAQALMTMDKNVKQLSYAFDLGDISCKMGAICKGSKRVCPNMATVLGVITTDVKISPEMLQRALSTTVKETFNLMDIDGVASPNDMLCIMANGRAGNYEISVADSEYKKFCFVLREVLAQMCRKIAEDGEDFSKIILCKAYGARSRTVSDAVAKSVIGSIGVRKAIAEGKMEMEDLLCAITSAGQKISVNALHIVLESELGAVTLYEDGKIIGVSENVLQGLLLGVQEARICIDLREGYYASTAIGRDCF